MEIPKGTTMFRCDCGRMIPCSTRVLGEYRVKFLNGMEAKSFRVLECEEGQYHATSDELEAKLQELLRKEHEETTEQA